MKKRFQNFNLSEKTFFFISLLLVVYVRLRFADAPFERDEGEYAYAGMMILKGELPYRDFYNMKLPGVYYSYAIIFKLFGQSVAVVRYSLLCLNLLTAFFTFQIARNWLNHKAAYWASGIFLLLSLGFHGQGFIANCEQFVNVFIAAGFVFLSRKLSLLNLFVGGFFIGVATLMKQHAFHFALFPIFLLLKNWLNERNLRAFLSKMTALGFGFALPLTMTVFWIWQKGIFESFYFFIVQYASAYSTLPHTFYENVDNFMNFFEVAVDNMLLWLFLFATLFFILKTAKKGLDTEGSNFAVLFLISFVSICPGFYFRNHYFQLIFIPSALLIAFGLMNYEAIAGKLNRYLTRSWFVILSLAVMTAIEIEYFGLKSVDHVTSVIYRYAYFTEMRQVGEYLKQNVKPSETVGQFGVEPEIWFYAQKRASSGFLYAYPMLENHQFAAQLIEKFKTENEKTQPEWFILQDLTKAEMASKNLPRLQFWANSFLKNYEPKAILYANDKLTASFETNFFNIDTTREVILTVYKRKVF